MRVAEELRHVEEAGSRRASAPVVHHHVGLRIDPQFPKDGSRCLHGNGQAFAILGRVVQPVGGKADSSRNVALGELLAGPHIDEPHLGNDGFQFGGLD